MTSEHSEPPPPSAIAEPHPDRLDPEHPGRTEILRRHDAAVTAGSPGYADPATGYTVFTAQYLADRGWCCDQGCRHCPWLARSDD